MEGIQGLFRFFPPAVYFLPPSRSCGCCHQCTCILFTKYIFRESVDIAHKSQISSTFQEGDCSLKLVKINKQVFAITLLGKNLNHTAQLSISAREEIIILSVGLGGGKKRKKPGIHAAWIFRFLTDWGGVFSEDTQVLAAPEKISDLYLRQSGEKTPVSSWKALLRNFCQLNLHVLPLVRAWNASAPTLSLAAMTTLLSIFPGGCLIDFWRTGESRDPSSSKRRRTFGRLRDIRDSWNSFPRKSVHMWSHLVLVRLSSWISCPPELVLGEYCS